MSPWSAIATFTTYATVPGEMEAPTLVKATQHSLHVSWTAPEDGGSEVMDYQLECDDGDLGPFQRVFTGMAHERTLPNLQV